MSAKLFRENRSAVVDRIVRAAFGPQLDMLQAREHDLAEQVYEAGFSEADRLRMTTLPAGWLPRTSAVKVMIRDSIATLNLKRPQLVPYLAKDHVLWSVDIDSDFAKEWFRWFQDRSDFFNQSKKVEDNAWAVLNACRTVAELLMMWPEVAVFLGDLADPAPPPVTLPSNQIAVLNETLRLSTSGVSGHA